MPTSARQNAPFLRKSTANSQLPNGPTESSAPTSALSILFRCRGGRLCPPGRMHRFYGNLRRIRNFPMGRCGHRPLRLYWKTAQKPNCELDSQFGKEETALENKRRRSRRLVSSKPFLTRIGPYALNSASYDKKAPRSEAPGRFASFALTLQILSSVSRSAAGRLPS